MNQLHGAARKTSPTQTDDQEQVYEGTATSHSDTTLADDTTYYYTLFARDTSGNQSISRISAKTPDTVATGPVTEFTATAADRQVTLAWTNPTDSDFKAVRVLRSTSDYATSATQSEGQTNIYEGADTSYTDTGISNGTTYYYTVFASDSSGNWSARSTTSSKPVAAKPTTLTLSSSKSVVPYNEQTVLTGKLSTSAGTLPEGKTIAVERSTNSGSIWTTDGTATYDPASKAYTATRTLQSNATFRLRFAGDPFYTAATSPGVFVKAKAYLTQPVTPDIVTKNTAFTTHGYLEPRHSGRTRLYFYRYRNGAYRLYKYVNATNSDYDTDTMMYTLRHKLPYAGKWRVKAFHKDASHAASWSSERAFVVK